MTNRRASRPSGTRAISATITMITASKREGPHRFSGSGDHGEDEEHGGDELALGGEPMDAGFGVHEEDVRVSRAGCHRDQVAVEVSPAERAAAFRDRVSRIARTTSPPITKHSTTPMTPDSPVDIQELSTPATE